MGHRFYVAVFAVIGGIAALAALGVGGAHGIAALDLGHDLPALGLWGPFAIIGLRFLAALSGVVPSSPVLLAAGATEGVLLGSVYVLIGAELGALLGFLVGRYFGRDFVERRGWIDAAAKTRFGRWLLDKDTPQWQLMVAVFVCRLVPGASFDALSYVAGVTRITVWRFCLASFAALLPYTVLVVAAGQQLVTLGPGVLAAVLAGLVVSSAVLVLWPKFYGPSLVVQGRTPRRKRRRGLITLA